MYEQEYHDCLMEYYESLVVASPFEGLTEDECEELLRELNGDYEDDYQRNGRF